MHENDELLERLRAPAATLRRAPDAVAAQRMRAAIAERTSSNSGDMLHILGQWLRPVMAVTLATAIFAALLLWYGATMSNLSGLEALALAERSLEDPFVIGD